MRSGRVSAAGRGCRTSSRRWSSSGSSPSLWAIRAWAHDGSRPSSHDRAGAGLSSRQTASGAAYAATVFNTRARRLSLVAGYAAPYEPPRPLSEQRHVEAERPGELVGFDCFFVGRLHNMKQTAWQLTAIDVCSSYAWAELISCPRQPSSAHTSRLARRVAAELRAAGWQLERALTDNGPEFRSQFEQTITSLQARVTHIRAGRPQTNGAVEALHKTILDECWRPAFARYLQVRFTGLKRELADYLAYYNNDRAHTGRLTRGRTPADIVHGAAKMETR